MNNQIKKSNRILVLQHVPFEGPGAIAAWADQRGYKLETIRLYDYEAVPDLEPFTSMVIMGGPMSVFDHDKYPWLNDEKRAIENFIKSGRPVLGICLGAQLIANVMGSRIYPGKHKEIGWYPVEATIAETGDDLDLLPKNFEAFHWHGETFDLPTGAVHLAESEACRNQAFIYDNRVVGLQFHLEITPQVLNGLIDNCGDEIDDGKYVQTIEKMRGEHQKFYKANGLMQSLLDRLFDPD